MMNSLYGNFRTRKFTDIYEDAETFVEEYNETPFAEAISDDSLELLFYLLYAEYGNSHICSSDENQFKYKLFSIIFTEGPIWEKRRDIQGKLRSLTDDEITNGSTIIYSHAQAPGELEAEMSTVEPTILKYINDQNTSKYKKSKIEAYSSFYDLIKQDVTKEFVKKFKKLFLTIVEPQEPLWYVTEGEE